MRRQGTVEIRDERDAHNSHGWRSGPRLVLRTPVHDRGGSPRSQIREPARDEVVPDPDTLSTPQQLDRQMRTDGARAASYQVRSHGVGCSN